MLNDVLIGKRGTVFTEKKEQNSDAIKKVTSNAEGETVYPSDGQIHQSSAKDLSFIPI